MADEVTTSTRQTPGEWLREVLERNGPTPKRRVMELAKVAGYTEGSVRTAATKLNLTFRRESKDRPGLVWALSNPKDKFPPGEPGKYHKLPHHG